MSRQLQPPLSLVKTEPLAIIKNEPPESEIMEIGVDDVPESSDKKIISDIKDVDIVSHVLCEDSVKSETAPTKILEGKHLESVETRVLVRAESSPFIKAENITQNKNLNMTEDSRDANVSRGTGQGLVEVQDSNQALVIPVEPHEYTTSAKDKHVCSHCLYVFTKLEYVKFHIKKMHRVVTQMYQCPYCPYKSKCSVREHVIHKHKDTKYIQWFQYRCDNCDYKTYTSTNLNKHKITHLKPEEIQYFYCYHCSYKSNLKENLKKHILRHFRNGEVPFYCYICNFVTLKREIIIQHIKQHSKVQNKSEISEEN